MTSKSLKAADAVPAPEALTLSKQSEELPTSEAKVESSEIDSPTPALTLDQIKLVHATLLEEYKSRRAEIVANMQASYQIQNITITAAGLLVAGLKMIIDSGVYELLGIAAVVFYALAWSQLRYVTSVSHMSTHIMARTVPGLRAALEDLGPLPESVTSRFLTWEFEGAKVQHSNPGWLRLIDMASFGTPLIVAGLTSAGYTADLLRRVPAPLQSGLEPLDLVLTCLNGVMFVYTIAAALKIRALESRSPEERIKSFRRALGLKE